jgi:glutaredoxin domain-containing cysteine-rich protein 1
MGCASSKRIEAAVEYRPASASFAVFNINGIQEPWLGLEDTMLQQEHNEKPAHVPEQILDKLDAGAEPG